MPRTGEQQAAYDKIADLIERFDNQKEVYKGPAYNEMQVRDDFVKPFFEALGWDVHNNSRKEESKRDVKHEYSFKKDKILLAPDFSFTIDGLRKFFLETKRPSVNLITESKPAFQLRRYGWSAKMPISILTDFEEFLVYDCTIEPHLDDNTNKALVHKPILYNQYLEEFDWLWDLFHRESIVAGSLEKFAKADKKGVQSVDSVFLKSLDEWRSILANSIALNIQLGEDEINYIVQVLLDRIIFLRNCEDRGAEPYERLKECLENANNEGDSYRKLFTIFQEADRKYNSGLFDGKKDIISQSVVIENRVIKTIIEGLYYPNSPYEFSVIGAEILGTAYERFLGKVIRLTPERQVIIEEKPEVRKAGGVYYTPQYIVEYIVKNTIGKLIEGKTPEEIAKIKICDPACGSGSFLIGAYQHLLDYHRDWYTKKYTKSRVVKYSPLTTNGHLTTYIKKQILLNNIFGVDIDTQAVEVTKLSLLMKCMEGETAASMQTTLTFERVLPTLDHNIKSGNSLIDFDFYDGLLDFGEDKKIKPFNWGQAFPEVFRQGGFDAVIGNPPYVRSKLLSESDRAYFSNKFQSAVGTYDLYSIFIERSYHLIKQNGLVAFINPNKYFYSEYGAGIRKFIHEKYNILGIVDFNEFQIFNGEPVVGF